MTIAALLLTSAFAAGLKIRDAAAPAAASPAAAPAGGPAAAGPAAAPPPPIRPGVVVRITKSHEQLMASFKGTPIRHVPEMEEMLGKDFVVKEMKYGGAGLSSPDGTQKDTWYFPLAALTPWMETAAAKRPPVAGAAAKVVGTPTRAQVDLAPPGRDEAPWDYHVKGKHLMDPIAPRYNEQVDLEKSGMPLPPWMKVKQVATVECMEKMHKDPKHICGPEHYINYNLVTPTPTTAKPLTEKDAKALKNRIKHLESKVKSLTPEEPKKTEVKFEIPGMKEYKMGSSSDVEKYGAPKDRSNKKMKVGIRKPSNQGLNTAQGNSEEKKGESDEVVHEKKKKGDVVHAKKKASSK